MEKAIKYKKAKIRRSKPQRILFGVVAVMFALYGFTLVYPFIWSFLNSLKTNREFASGNSLAFPEVWRFSNYVVAFKELSIRKTNMFGMIFNSLWFTFGATAINIFVCCCTSYVICKYKFFGRNFLYSLAIVMMMLPIVGALPAQYKMVSTLGLKDSPLFLLTFTGGFGFNFIILYSFFKSLSWTYAEAAKIDGAGHMRIYLKVMLPQAIGPIMALAVVQAIGFWNDYMTPLLYMRPYPTLASGLYEFDPDKITGGNYPVYFAGLIMSMLPVLIVFGLFQNTIMQNTVAGGLKG